MQPPAHPAALMPTWLPTLLQTKESKSFWKAMMKVHEKLTDINQIKAHNQIKETKLKARGRVLRRGTRSPAATHCSMYTPALAWTLPCCRINPHPASTLFLSLCRAVLCHLPAHRLADLQHHLCPDRQHRVQLGVAGAPACTECSKAGQPPASAAHITCPSHSARSATSCRCLPHAPPTPRAGVRPGARDCLRHHRGRQGQLGHRPGAGGQGLLGWKSTPARQDGGGCSQDGLQSMHVLSHAHQLPLRWSPNPGAGGGPDRVHRTGHHGECGGQGMWGGRAFDRCCLAHTTGRCSCRNDC